MFSSSNIVVQLQSTQIRSIWTQKCSCGVKWAFGLSNYSSHLCCTSNGSISSLKCARASLNLDFNSFGIYLCFFTLQSLKSDALDLKSHSIHSQKHFHTQRTQTIFSSIQNILNDFKQTFQHSTFNITPLNI